MIPFEELSAALDRWRIRNGLPVVSADLPIIPDAERPATTPQFVMPASAPATQPRTAPPGAKRPGTDSDVFSIGDADVVEDDEYANEGGDYAMEFGGAPAPEAVGAAPAQGYDEESADYEVAEQATHVADDGPYAYQDPAYDTPQPLEAAPPPAEPAPLDEEEEEDWSKMPNFPGHSSGPDTIDGDDVLDESDDDRKR
jgi:hypothetical protein